MAKKTNDKFSDRIQKKKERAMKEEKIVNSFLLQVTYSILAFFLVLFLSKCMLYEYGTALGQKAPYIIWSLFGIFTILAIFSFVIGRSPKKRGFRIFGIYMAITALMMFWCVGIEQFLKIIKFPYINNRPVVFTKSLKWIILLSIPAEIVVYFIRMTKLKKK